MNIKSEKIRKKVAIMSLSLLMASGGICSNVFYQPIASAGTEIENVNSQEQINLGKFDVDTKTFKDASGQASFTDVNQVVIYCPAENIANINDLGGAINGYSKNDTISTPNSTVIDVEGGKNAKEIAEGLLKKLKFKITGVKDDKDYTVKVNLNKVAETNKTVYYNGHIFELVRFAGAYNANEWTWYKAYENAQKLKKDGKQGYLATISTLEESEIIGSIVPNSGGQGYVRAFLGGIFTENKDGKGVSIGETRNGFYDKDTLKNAESKDLKYMDINNKNIFTLRFANGPEADESVTVDESTYSFNNNDGNNDLGRIFQIIQYSSNIRKYVYNNYWNSKYGESLRPNWYVVEYGGIEEKFGTAKDSASDANTTTSEAVVPTYKMQWTFEKTANTITAKYDTSKVGYYGGKDEAEINISNIKSYTISVNAPSIYYTGKVYNASKIELKNHEGTGAPTTLENLEGKYTVKYLSENGTELQGAPKEIGNYILALTLKPAGGESAVDTLKVNFRILPSPVYIPDGFGKEEIPANITPADIDKVRAAGADRIDTAINISKAFYQKADNVVVANAWNFPDALSASVLANILKAPILLNGAKTLDTRVNAEITRLGVKDAVVVGGENSLAKAVQNSLNVFDKNGTQRISGDNRYATSAKIAEEIFKATKKSDTVVIASGENFADSLSAAGFASKNGYPILLVKKNTVPSEITNVLKKYNVKNTIIVGGTGSVSDQVAKEIKAIAPNQERIAGKDRYDTSVQVAKLKMADTDKAFIASGKNFADALVVGAIAGANNQSVILVSDKGDNKAAKDYLKANIKKINVIGGEDTVPTSLVIDLLK